MNRECLWKNPRQKKKQAYQETENGEQFLLYDSGIRGPQRVIIFSSQQAVKFLSNSAHCFYGTFKVRHDIFSRCTLCIQNREDLFFHVYFRFFQIKQKPLIQDSIRNFFKVLMAMILRTYYWTLKKVLWMLLIIFDHKLKERVAFITYVPMSGNIFRTSRKRYVDCKAWILKIVDGYSNRQVLDYLRNISHNLAFWLWQIHFKQSGPARQSRHRGHVPLPNNGWSIMYFSPFVVFYCCNISRLFILLKI